MEAAILLFVAITSMSGSFIGVMFAFRIKNKWTLEERNPGYQPKLPEGNSGATMPICKPPKKK